MHSIRHLMYTMASGALAFAIFVGIAQVIQSTNA